jgi:hypothetical protein
MKRTAEDLYVALRRAGFGENAANTMVAIAMGESGGDDTNVGDVDLQGSYWGPSYGAFQVRTVKGLTGTGQTRDITWLAASLENQAKAAYEISGGGTDFTAWTVYNTGKYREFEGFTGSAGSTGSTTTAGLWGVPTPADAFRKALDALIDPVKTNLQQLSVQVLAIGLGISLVIVGGYAAVRKRAQ